MIVCVDAGEYYKYDDSRSSHHDSIMASQLDGHWYLRASDVTDYEVCIALQFSEE